MASATRRSEVADDNVDDGEDEDEDKVVEARGEVAKPYEYE